MQRGVPWELPESDRVFSQYRAFFHAVWSSLPIWLPYVEPIMQRGVPWELPESDRVRAELDSCFTHQCERANQSLEPLSSLKRS